ncbi:hypothetical protein AcW1_001050 [Taiwanofungus camphoratus]|nr:hypothetical protein AcW1_001050 [Antrodia cinnamomea]
MPSPSLIVVPATPIDSLRPPLSPLLTTTTTVSTPELTPTTTATTTPDPSSGDCERSSSETTIVTIYSMYEEDPGSWSAGDALVGHRHRPSKDVSITGVGVRESYLRSNGTAAEDSAYYDAASDWQPASKRSTTMDMFRQSVLSDGSVQLAYTDSRPSSGYASTSVTDSQAQSPHQSYRALSSPDRLPKSSLPPQAARHRKTNSSQSIGVPNGTSSLSPARLALTARPLHSSLTQVLLQPPQTPPSTPPRHPSPSGNTTTKPPLVRLSEEGPQASQRQSAYAQIAPPRPSASSSSAQAFLTPPSSPPGRASLTSSPSSKRSLVRSSNEDPDAFHVRSTYAQLDECGVRGDGYEEGVERTRARVGGSRASELRAEEALADEEEKTRDLTPLEISMLASLDRYGFYVTPSHDRIILLPATPLLKPHGHVSAASTNASPTAPLIRSLPPAHPLPKELSRVAKWARMLEARSRDKGRNIEAWGIRPGKEHKLSERTFKGIPDCWRRAAWDMLMCRFSKQGGPETRRLMEQYHETLDQPSSYDVQIDLDVPRTISGHVMFRTRYGQGQRSLFHVLHCLSLHCETCGYVQGMGPIAATLLCYFEPERAYASLIRLHNSYSMHSIFSPGFPGLLEAIYVQERITEQMLPAVYAAFKKHMVSTTSYATKWYITLFANSVPFQTQLRLWDAFLLEGHDIFVIVAVAIVWVYRDHITSESANFETVLSLLSSFFVPEDENALLAWIEKVASDKKLRSDMRRWRGDWHRLVAAGQHTQALL